MQTRLLLIHATSPLHVGTGQGMGLIDLPIAREVTTGHPLVPGSSLKGTFRAQAWSVDNAPTAPDSIEGGHSRRQPVDALTCRLFGPDTDDADRYPSALRFSDANVLLFPIRSDRGTFAWVTCPLVLARLKRDAGESSGLARLTIPEVGQGKVAVAKGSALTDGKRVVLNGLDFETSSTDAASIGDALASRLFPGKTPGGVSWRSLFLGRIAVVSDDTFTWLVEHGTEVRARIRIDNDRGTVAEGGLWYEESLPAETILSGLVQFIGNGQVAPDEAWSALDRLCAEPIQVGGHASTGQGMTRVRLHGTQR